MGYYKKYYKEHREKEVQRTKQYYRLHRAEILAKRRERMKTDPEYAEKMRRYARKNYLSKTPEERLAAKKPYKTMKVRAVIDLLQNIAEDAMAKLVAGTTMSGSDVFLEIIQREKERLEERLW